MISWVCCAVDVLAEAPVRDVLDAEHRVAGVDQERRCCRRRSPRRARRAVLVDHDRHRRRRVRRDAEHEGHAVGARGRPGRRRASRVTSVSDPSSSQSGSSTVPRYTTSSAEVCVCVGTSTAGGDGEGLLLDRDPVARVGEGAAHRDADGEGEVRRERSAATGRARAESAGARAASPVVTGAGVSRVPEQDPLEEAGGPEGRRRPSRARPASPRARSGRPPQVDRRQQDQAVVRLAAARRVAADDRDEGDPLAEAGAAGSTSKRPIEASGSQGGGVTGDGRGSRGAESARTRGCWGLNPSRRARDTLIPWVTASSSSWKGGTSKAMCLPVARQRIVREDRVVGERCEEEGVGAVVEHDGCAEPVANASEPSLAGQRSSQAAPGGSASIGHHEDESSLARERADRLEAPSQRSAMSPRLSAGDTAPNSRLSQRVGETSVSPLRRRARDELGEERQLERLAALVRERVVEGVAVEGDEVEDRRAPGRRGSAPERPSQAASASASAALAQSAGEERAERGAAALAADALAELLCGALELRVRVAREGGLDRLREGLGIFGGRADVPRALRP